MPPNRWDPIQTELDCFHTYFAAQLPKLEIIAACDRNWTDDEYRQRRPKGFPGLLRGVYLIFDNSEELKYVGLATGCFDKRVWSHDSWLQRRYTDIIAFSDAYIFLAPALEYFLISRLRPSRNSIDFGEIPPLDS